MRPGEIYPSDLLLDPSQSEFRSTNLKTKSALRLHKLATIHSKSLVRYLGIVDAPTQEIVAGKLRDLLGLGTTER